MLQVWHFKDLIRLVIRLRDMEDEISLYIKRQLSPDTLQLVDEYNASIAPSESLQNALIAELNKLLSRECLYNEQCFACVKLTNKTKELIKQRPKGEDLIYLNQLLLAEAYPNEIVKKDLTEEGFNTLLAWLDPDQNLAGEKYERIRQKLIRFFASKGYIEAEGLSDETINRVAQRISEWEKEGKIMPNNPQAFCWGVAKNVAHEFSRHQEQIKKSLFDGFDKQQNINIAQDQLGFSDREQDNSVECLKRCLNEFPQEAQTLIIKYYERKDEDKEGELKRNRIILADSLGIEIRALHARVLRLRERLKKCVSNCMKSARS